MQRAGLATGRENPRCRVGSVSEKLIATIHDCIVPHRPPASNIITATLCALPSAAAATAATAAATAKQKHFTKQENIERHRRLYGNMGEAERE